MLEETNINSSFAPQGGATEDKPSSPTPPDALPSAPVAPAEPIPAPPVATPEPIAPSTPPPPVPAAPSTDAPPPASNASRSDAGGPNPLLSKGGGTDVRSLLSKALAKIQFRKQAKLEKIMILARSKGQVTNDDAQKLLRVSDATATRYLAQLVKAGRLQRAGVRGGAVYRFVQ